MKRITSIFAVAAAVIAFNACERQEVEALKTIDHLTFTSAKPEVEDAVGTKTGWNGKSVQWLAGDKIRVGFTLDGEWQSSGKAGDTTPRFYASSALDADASNASFSLPIGSSSFQESVKDLEGDIVFYGVYPSSACEAGQADAPNVFITIPSEQKPSANSFDSSADILLGCTETLEEITEDPVLMSWNRIVALADITLKELNIPEGENLLRLTLTAQDGANLVGGYTVNVTDGSVSGDGENEVTLNVSSLEITSDNTLEVWAGFLPETVTSLKVVLTTDVATYTKEISNISLAFKKNKRNILGIKMGDAVREGKEVNKFALLETSNVTLEPGENGYDDLTVDGQFAIKVGTSSKGGSMSVVVPKGSTMLHVHAAAWNGVDGLSLNISGATTNPTSIELKPDSGIAGTGPFELEGSVDDYYYAIELSGIDAETEITFTSSSAKRFVVWGVNVEPEPKEITWELADVELTADPNKLEYTVGQTFNPAGMVLTAVYVDADDESNTKTVVLSNDEVTFEPSLTTPLTLDDDQVTVIYGEFTFVFTITVSEASTTSITDELTYALIGVTGTSYSDWSNKKSNSNAVYAGQSAGGNNSIQLRSNNNNSGIITTASGGKVTKVKLTWNSNSADGRTISVYGSSTAYSTAADLYDSEKQGTLLGEIKNGSSTELEIEGDYTFIGLRSKSSALYLDKVEITWE